MSSRPDSSNKQRGAALFISLVFLTVLALLGITLARNSSMEERMAGNMRDRNLGFQAAEAALQDAEANLSGFLSNAFDGSTPGLVAYDATDANDPDYWNSLNWDNTDSQQVTTTLAHVETKARYVIDKRTALETVDINGTPTTITVQYFRVTVRGVGATADSVVILQAEYRYY